jgi:hypothetical protein
MVPKDLVRDADTAMLDEAGLRRCESAGGELRGVRNRDHG